MTKQEKNEILNQYVGEFEMTVRTFFRNCLIERWEDDGLGTWKDEFGKLFFETDNSVGKLDKAGNLEITDRERISQMFDELVKFAVK